MANHDADAKTVAWACDTAQRFALEIDAARVMVELTMPESVSRLVAERELEKANNRLGEFLADLGSTWGVDPTVVIQAIADRAKTD